MSGARLERLRYSLTFFHSNCMFGFILCVLFLQQYCFFVTFITCDKMNIQIGSSIKLLSSKISKIFPPDIVRFYPYTAELESFSQILQGLEMT